MEEKIKLIESLFEKAEAYAKTNIDLYKLKAIDKSADVVATIASKLIVMIIVFLVIIMINIGLALWIGELMGKSYYGFFVMAALYVLIGLILHFNRDQLIKTPINDSLITQFLKEK